jgi:hypothetical protein
MSSKIGIDRSVADAPQRGFHHVSFTDINGSMLPSSVLRGISAACLGANDLLNSSIRGDRSNKEEICWAPLL